MIQSITNFRNLFYSENETEEIPITVFDLILENTKEFGLTYELNRSYSHINALNGLLSKIHTDLKSIESYYAIGYRLNHSHLFIVGSFQYFISQNKSELRSEFFKVLQSKISAGQIDIEVPLKSSFKKLDVRSRKVFEQIVLGFLDRVSEILFGKTCEQARLIKNSLTVSISEPLGISPEIVNSIQPTRYNYTQLKKLFIPILDISLVDQITNLLVRDIGFSLEEISTHLNKSKRSVQRELKSQGLYFLSIKEDTRKLLLKSYLKKGVIKIDELADLLAYSDRSAFEKAHKKWCGKNISEVLKNLTSQH